MNAFFLCSPECTNLQNKKRLAKQTRSRVRNWHEHCYAKSHATSSEALVLSLQSSDGDQTLESYIERLILLISWAAGNDGVWFRISCRYIDRNLGSPDEKYCHSWSKAEHSFLFGFIPHLIANPFNEMRVLCVLSRRCLQEKCARGRGASSFKLGPWLELVPW